MMLVRLAHPFYARTLEFIFGADRTRITRWTNTCIDWLFDCYNHLLQLNVARFTEKAQVYADAVGRKMGSADACRNLLMVDGIFVYVTLILLSKIATQTNPPLSTHRPICKPRLAQEIYYSGESCVRHSPTPCAPSRSRTLIIPSTIPYALPGYYKGHGLKFQGCVAASGLFEDFFGPRQYDYVFTGPDRVDTPTPAAAND